jgi:hypothetical protein
MDSGNDISKLTMCAKILYDRDVIDKNKENRELKEKLKEKEDKIKELEETRKKTLDSLNNFRGWVENHM